MKPLIDLLISLGVEVTSELTAEAISDELIKAFNSKDEEIKKLVVEIEDLKKDPPTPDKELDDLVREHVNAAIRGTGILKKKPEEKKPEKVYKKRKI